LLVEKLEDMLEGTSQSLGIRRSKKHLQEFQDTASKTTSTLLMLLCMNPWFIQLGSDCLQTSMLKPERLVSKCYAFYCLAGLFISVSANYFETLEVAIK